MKKGITSFLLQLGVVLSIISNHSDGCFQSILRKQLERTKIYQTKLFDTLQKNTHIVAHYFDIRTQNYFSDVMSPAFGVTTFWYRQEFAKSRGMVHWHGLCWRSDREPHNLLSKAIEEGLSDSDCSARLADWAAT